MAKVTKDVKFEDFVLGLITKNYSERESRIGGPWHVSDLMFPRYAVLSRLSPRLPDRTSIGFFLTGEAYHEFMQKLLGKHDSEVKGTYSNTTGTADYFDGDTLLEIKTSRKWTIPEEPQSHYVEQAGYYCAIFGKSSARILVIFPTAGRKWNGEAASTIELVAWNVSFTDEELAEIKASVVRREKYLDEALKTKVVTGLPCCQDWKCGSVERDTEKQTYFIKLRCPFALDGSCAYNSTLDETLAYKMEHRRVLKPKKGA